MNIYVGNLPWSVSDEDLREMFVPYGEVSAARVITDRDSGRSRGFGFVEMPTDTEAEAAIAGLNGNDVDGRALNVNQARPRADRPDRGGSGGRRRY